jgi:DNA-directed RNA polymerase specialized sigma subunit
MARREKRLKMTPEQQLLASANLNLARDLAWKYNSKTQIEYKILEGAAFEGLCQAAARYNPELINEDTGKPMKFSSLAVPYIRGSILHYIRDRTYSLKLTHRTRELWVKGRKMLMRGCSDIEIARALEIDLAEWQDTKTACSGPPLELKDQATPTESLEPEEVDQLTPFREEAAELISKLSDVTKKRLVRFVEAKSGAIPVTVRNELKRLAGLGVLD